MFPEFVKKHPPKVKAVQLERGNVVAVSTWCNGSIVDETDPIDGSKHVGINFMTPHGVKRVSEGEYLVQDHEGYFHKYGPNAFEANFEQI